MIVPMKRLRLWLCPFFGFLLCRFVSRFWYFNCWIFALVRYEFGNPKPNNFFANVANLHHNHAAIALVACPAGVALNGDALLVVN